MSAHGGRPLAMEGRHRYNQLATGERCSDTDWLPVVSARYSTSNDG